MLFVGRGVTVVVPRCVPIISTSLLSDVNGIIIVLVTEDGLLSVAAANTPSTKTMKVSSDPSFFVASIKSLGRVSWREAVWLVACTEKTRLRLSLLT